MVTTFRSNFRLVLLAVTWLSQALPVQAHSGIHERIEALTRQIQRNPGNAELYLKRGELFRVREDWESALADYDRALACDADLQRIYMVRGRANFEARQFTAALVDLNHFLSYQPNHLEGLVTRARVRSRLGNYLVAARDYDRALAHLRSPTPEYFLERAEALTSSGDAYHDQALAGLDEAIRILGPLVTLEQRAISLEMQRQRYNNALARLDRIGQWMAPERRLHQRGEILREAGRVVDARQAFSRALEHIESLPPMRRQRPSTRQLTTDLRTALGLDPGRQSPSESVLQ